jgi:hypothetical protein
MVDSKIVYFLGSDGSILAESRLNHEEEGWFSGTIVWQRFPVEIKKALDWYDEVVQGQMLSYLDEAEAAVRKFELTAKFPDGSTHKTYALNIGPSNSVSFRISPIATRSVSTKKMVG